VAVSHEPQPERLVEEGRTFNVGRADHDEVEDDVRHLMTSIVEQRDPSGDVRDRGRDRPVARG
jgi:hypothetical protein